MARLPKVEALALAEYLASEARRSRRYEYLDGQVYPLAEVSPAHEQIRQNLEALLLPRTQAEHTRLYTGQTRLKIGHNRLYYPDLMVVAQPSPNPQYEEYPSLIVEICTWETERIDRGEKLVIYQSIPGLVGYLMIHTERRLVEATERGMRGNWQYSALGHQGELELYSPQMRLSLEQIYAGL